MSLLNIEALTSISERGQLGIDLQLGYKNAWNTLKLEHQAGLDSVEVTSQLTRLMDEIIDIVFNRTVEDMKREGKKPDRSLALLALGSYGRKELAPHSDVDLLFLTPLEVTKWVGEFTERVLYLLWDTGLDVGYSTRSAGECFQLAQENYDVLTSILDARFLQGNPECLTQFQKDFRNKILDRVGSDFVRAKLESMEERLKKHGGTIYVLEPNIKEGMGGLRDIHTSLWVAKVLFDVNSFEELSRRDDLKILDKKDLKVLNRSLQFLQKVRCELHFASNAARDLLTMERQPFLAARLGFEDKKTVPGVERFMQEFYSHTGQVHHVTEHIIKRSLDRKRKAPRILQVLKERDLGNGFFAREGALITKGDPGEFFVEDPARLMEVFEKFQMTNLELSPELSVAIRRSHKLVNDEFRKDKGIRDMFFRILSQDRRLYDTLLLMNELRFLGKYIPEFASIHCKMQHDYYHTYTVDEHSIRAIKELVDLPASGDQSISIYKEVYREVGGMRNILFLTTLLHDIGKGQGSNHAERGARMAAKAAKRFGFSKEDIEIIEFLILNHLHLSHIAQRRDLHEEKTILESAKLVADIDRLKLLYLLTMADLKAVGPAVWNDWKGSLITELFLETYKVIEQGGLSREELLEKMILARAFIERSLLKKYSVEEIKSELDVLTERAYALFRPGMLARLLGMKLKMGDRDVSSSWRQAREGGYTNLHIVAKDHPGLFSKIAGVLAANNINILGAQIHTRKDGIVFDVLHVTDSVLRPVTDRVKFRIVKRELENVVSGELDVEELFITRKPSLPLDRRDKALPGVPTRVEIDNESSDDHTVIDIYTKDRIGLLYKITSTLTALGLSIYTAKVSTKVDQAVDVFYVKDLSGRKITNIKELERIKNSLEGALVGSGND